jgi:hypothetical protein
MQNCCWTATETTISASMTTSRSERMIDHKHIQEPFTYARLFAVDQLALHYFRAQLAQHLLGSTVGWLHKAKCHLRSPE